MEKDVSRRIILASASPRRKEILTLLGARFTVISADADESSEITSPRELTKHLAKIKGEAVLNMLASRGENDGAIIISADTVVCCDGKILGKPHSPREAREMLSLLSGKAHTVLTGIAVTYNGKTETAVSEAHVYVDSIPDSEIEKYIASGEPFDKAGGYGIQGSFGKWISRIDGCYFGVVGLPANLLCKLFKDTVGVYIDEI